MPGGQLVNKLQDMNYRVGAINNLMALLEGAREASPILVLVDLSGGDTVCEAIAALKADTVTSHIPVIAFAAETAAALMGKARQAGARLVVSDAAVISHLPELLNQALQIE